MGEIEGIAGVQKLKQMYMDKGRHKRMSPEYTNNNALDKKAVSEFHQIYMAEFSKELAKGEHEYKEKFIKESLDEDERRVLTDPIMHKILIFMVHQYKDEMEKGMNHRMYETRLHYILENYFNEFMYHYTTYLIQMNKQLNSQLMNEISNRTPSPYFTWKESSK